MANKEGPVVVKLGGDVVQGPAMAIVAADLAELARTGAPVLVVHGGGPQATDLQRKLGQTPVVIGGRRVTDQATLDVIKMVVAGKMNVDCCAALLAAGARPVGLHGASALAIHAKRKPPAPVTGGGTAPVDFGFVGDVVGIGENLLAKLMTDGYLPVLACVGADSDGSVYNINADAVANQVAIRLAARALLLVTDVPGVLRDVEDPQSRIPHLTVDEGRRAIAAGVVTKGMIPKLEESFAALEAGVAAVHIVGHVRRGDVRRAVEQPGSIGTVLVAGT